MAEVPNPVLHGLANLIAAPGTIGGVTPPPERENFESYDEFERAYDEWWVTTNFWKASKVDA